MALKDKEAQKAYGRTWRQTHPEQVKANNRAWRLAHPEESRANMRAWYQAHREEAKATSRAWRLAHPKQVKANNRASHQALTAEALRVLGDKCACPGCGVSEPAFLTIDHINGRSKGTRRTQTAIREAKASGWDKTKFQTLCFNCNCAKSAHGFCPVHQKDPSDRNEHSPSANKQLVCSGL